MRFALSRVSRPGISSEEKSPETSLASSLEDSRLGQVIIRIGMLAAASHLLYVAERFWFDGGALWNLQVVLLAFLMSGLAFVLFGIALAVRIPHRWQWLVLVALLTALFSQYYVRLLTYQPGEMGTDSALYSIYSADILLSGGNPYTVNMDGAYRLYNATDFYRTPRLDDTPTLGLPYPALHFLAFVPFRVAHVQDIRALYVLAHAGVLTLLYLHAPKSLRGIMLVPLYTNVRYLEYTLGWVSDIVWTLILVAMLLNWQRPTWRAVLYGLAAAYKQLPWFLAPFILVRLLLDDDDADTRPRLSRAAFFFGLAGTTFLAINGPFIFLSPRIWLTSVLEPLLASYIYFGSGLSTLTQLDFLPLTKSYYSWVTLVVMLTLLLIYIIKFRPLKHALWFFPGVVLWFSYRSLQNYFVYWVPLLLVATVEIFREPGFFEPVAVKIEERHRTRSSRRNVAAVIVIALAWIGALTGFFLYTAQPLQIQLADITMNEDPHNINVMVVTVHNTTGRTISPRLSVQKPGWQPYPWLVVSGQDELKPGESGDYLIYTDVDYRMFDIDEGAQIVVTDASGDYGLRGTMKLRGDYFDENLMPLHDE